MSSLEEETVKFPTVLEALLGMQKFFFQHLRTQLPKYVREGSLRMDELMELIQSFGLMVEEIESGIVRPGLVFKKVILPTIWGTLASLFKK